MQAVKVKFTNKLHTSEEYNFFCDISEVQVGDSVVVDTRYGLAVAEVTELGYDFPKTSRHVVQKVDMEAHKARLDKAKKIKETFQKLEKRRKSLEDMQIYIILAKEDPELAELLAEYRTLIQS